MFSLRNHAWSTLASVSLMSFCGSTLGDRIGLHGLDQWPLAGFALGILGLSYGTIWIAGARLDERLKSLENKVDADRK